MEFKAALASSIVAYLPNSLYLAFWVEDSSLPGMIRHSLVVLSTMIKPIGLCVGGLRDKED